MTPLSIIKILEEVLSFCRTERLKGTDCYSWGILPRCSKKPTQIRLTVINRSFQAIVCQISYNIDTAVDWPPFGAASFTISLGTGFASRLYKENTEQKRGNTPRPFKVAAKRQNTLRRHL
jgi:hypothetical protein